MAAAAFTFSALILYFAFADQIFNSDAYVQEEDELPVVSLVCLSPSLVREETSLNVTVRIDPPVPSGSDKVIQGGIQVFDSFKGTQVDALIAFAFRAGQETRDMSYLVSDHEVTTTDRTIRVRLNSGWDDHETTS